MSPEMVTAVSAMVVSGVTTVGGVVTVVIGRRQPRSTQRRDDFKVITDRHDRDIERLEHRVDEAEAEAEREREKSERDRRKIHGQDYALRYLAGWLRDLVQYIHRSGLEPPLPPLPVPEEAQPYLHDIGV